MSLFLSLAPASPALAVDDLSVDFGNTARLVDEGQAVLLKVRARCTVENGEVLEAFVYVVQNGNQSNFAGIPLTCTGGPGTQVFTIRVSALDFTFQTGEATANAFILILDPATGNTVSISEGETIQIR